MSKKNVCLGGFSVAALFCLFSFIACKDTGDTATTATTGTTATTPVVDACTAIQDPALCANDPKCQYFTQRADATKGVCAAKTAATAATDCSKLDAKFCGLKDFGAKHCAMLKPSADKPAVCVEKKATCDGYDKATCEIPGILATGGNCFYDDTSKQCAASRCAVNSGKPQGVCESAHGGSVCRYNAADSTCHEMKDTCAEVGADGAACLTTGILKAAATSVCAFDATNNVCMDQVADCNKATEEGQCLAKNISMKAGESDGCAFNERATQAIKCFPKLDACVAIGIGGNASTAYGQDRCNAPGILKADDATSGGRDCETYKSLGITYCRTKPANP